MLQAIGLTSDPRRDLPPAVDDLSFEARPGRVTALLGAAGSGKSTALRLMLELEPGRGMTYFRGNPLHRIAHPAREVGVLLGDVPGHPARTARGQLRMLCAAAGVPLARADEMLEAVGLAGLARQHLGALSRAWTAGSGLPPHCWATRRRSSSTTRPRASPARARLAARTPAGPR